MTTFKQILVLFYILKCVHGQWSYTPEQIEIFDLVDEVKSNFYEFLGVDSNTDQSQIRRTYRKLSLTMHPDKNKTEGAEENFRILVAIYGVLKNKEKREIYDNVLVAGLPASYLYVPRQIRKMSVLEVFVILSVTFSLGHYLFIWVAYFERRVIIDELTDKQRKKQKKKGVTDQEFDKIVEQAVPRPTYKSILPVLIVLYIFNSVIAVPGNIRNKLDEARLKREYEELERREIAEAKAQLEEETQRRNETKKVKQERNKQKKAEFLLAKQKSLESGPMAPSVFDEPMQSIEELEAMYDELDFEKKPKKSKKLNKASWDNEELLLLAKLVNKYPGGTPERWVKISKEMGRGIKDVTMKANSIRTGVGIKVKYSAATVQNKREVDQDISITKRVYEKDVDFKTNEEESKVEKKQRHCELKENLQNHVNTDNDIVLQDNNVIWEQNQQKLLEMALTQFPKSSAERWEKIAKCVPDKTKEQCIARYRFLAEKIQHRKKH